MEELLYFINDNDNLVKLKALSTSGKLAQQQYIDVHTFETEIFPVFLRLIESGFDEDQSQHFFSKMIGQFVF